MYRPIAVLLALLLLPLATCLTQSELRHRSIYQVLTDRFARPDEHMAPCDLARRRYCGGTWKGIERKLGYIQGMGFDTGERSRTAVMSCHFSRLGCCLLIGQCGSALWY
jgi:hypothetical protein